MSGTGIEVPRPDRARFKQSDVNRTMERVRSYLSLTTLLRRTMSKIELLYSTEIQWSNGYSSKSGQVDSSKYQPANCSLTSIGLKGSIYWRAS